MAIRLFFILSVTLISFTNFCYSKDNPIDIKISAPKIYDSLEIKFIYPRNYSETKIYPVIFADIHQPFRFKNLDPAFWNKFAEEGFIVIQICRFLTNKPIPKHTVIIDKFFFKNIQKDIPIDLNNIFSVGVNNSDFLYWSYIFQDLTAFKGVVCIEYLYEYHNFLVDSINYKKKYKKEMLILKLPILIISGKKNVFLPSIHEEIKKYKLGNFNIDFKIIDELPKIEDVSIIINWCHSNK